MKQTKLFLSLLMLVVFGIGNVWGAEVSLTQDEIKQSTANSSYKQTSVKSASGVWAGNMIVNTTTGYVQINKNKNNYYLKSPVFAGKVTKVVINTCNNTAKDRTFYLRSNTQTAQPTSGDYGSGTTSSQNGTVTINVTNAPSSFYIYASAAVYISSVIVTYEAGSSTEPSLSVDKTEIDFGMVEQGATLAAQTVSVKMENIETIMAGFETGCTAFSVSPDELSASGDLTITPNTSVAIGEYTSTLTIVDMDKLSKDVTVKMNVVKPFDGKTWEINTTNFDKVKTGSGYIPYNGSHTLNSISYESNSVMLQSSSLQFKKDEGYIYNTTNFGNITKIEITIQTGKSNNLTVYFGATKQPSIGSVTGNSVDNVTTYTAPDNCGFFNLQNGGDITNITSIKVYYYAVTPLSITVDENNKGKVTADKESAIPGEIVTLSAIPNKHYKFKEWLVYDDGMNEYEVDAENNTFKMPSVPVHVDATFVDGDHYTVIIGANDAKYGTAVFDGFTADTKDIYTDDDYTITATPTTDYRFVNWTAEPEANIDFVDANATTTQIKVLGAALIYANFEPIPVSKPAMITLWENGVKNPTKLNGNVGEAITLPTTAGGNCNKSVEFVGWSEVEITNSATQPASKFYALGAEYTPSVENVILYAVYAKKKGSVVFNETFDKCDGTGGNDNQWGGSNIANNNLNTDNTGWVYEKGNGANQCAKFGVSKTDGSATTPAMNFTGDAVLTFKAGAWTGDVKILNLVATNCTLSQSSVEMKDNGWTTFEIKITAATAEPKITFSATTNASAKARFFLDEVKVSTCLYSDYSTTCAEAVEVAVPTFSVEGGEYTEAQSVEILCETAGAAIYYTTDGKEPTNASTSYAGAIKVDKLMTIKAIAYVGTDNYSEVATAEYVVLQDAEVKWQTYGEDGSSKVDLTEATIYTDGDLDLFVYTPSNGKQTFTSTDESVAIVEEKTGLGGLKYLALSVKGAGTTTITVNVATDGTFAAGSASFVLHVEEHKQIVSMSFAEASYDATLGEEFAAPELTVTPSVAPIEYSSSDENVAKVDAATGEITLVGMGTATITANFAGNDAYDPATAYYTLNVTDSNVDILTIDIMNTTNGYDNFTCTGSVTGTSYVGNNMKSSKGNIQINKTPSGVVSTQSKGFLKTISVTFASENDSKHNGVDVYANVTPYETAADLYDTDKQGVKVATLSDIVGSKTVSFTVTNGNYPYIGIRSHSGVVYIEQIAIAWTPTEVIRDGLQDGEFGTICLNRGIDAGKYLGATFYEIAYMEKQNGNPYKIFFDEVTGELVAGKPYVYVADDEQIVVAYNEQYANAPIDGANGLTGTFGDIRDGAVGLSSNILENNYVISDNKFWLCKGNCWLLANRAYIKKDILDNEPQKAPLPGRRRIEMGSGQKVPTGVDNLSENATINQALQGTYDVLGRKIAQPTGIGFYIIDGKKVIVVE